jgi:hypothetical protein
MTTSRQTHRVEVLVAGQAISATAIRHEPQGFQSQLVAARTKFGSALCCCTTPPLQLVIRERSDKLFLAAWPEQAAKHALDCPFYSDHTAGPSGAAIEREGDFNRIALHHPLLQDNPALQKEKAPSTGMRVAREAGARTSKLHLWGLLHFLWEEGGLNRWYPGWHRDWGFVRHALRRAAQTTVVDGEALIQHLYVPPVWNQKKRSEILAHWAQFAAPMYENHRRTMTVQSGIVIGAVRVLEPSEFGHSIRLHHHAERFYMDQRVAQGLSQYSRRGWSALKHLDPKVDGDERAYVVAALRVQASQNRRMTIVEAVLMRVTPRFIPVNSSYEDKLARALVDQDRSFVRPLHYDNHSLNMPDFVLKDVASKVEGEMARQSVALFVYGAAVDPNNRAMREAADRQLAHQAGMGYWQWDAGNHAQPPPLPPATPAQVRPSTNTDLPPTPKSSKESP